MRIGLIDAPGGHLKTVMRSRNNAAAHQLPVRFPFLLNEMTQNHHHHEAYSLAPSPFQQAEPLIPEPKPTLP